MHTCADKRQIVQLVQLNNRQPPIPQPQHIPNGTFITRSIQDRTAIQNKRQDSKPKSIIKRPQQNITDNKLLTYY